jgi:hypothetical protein
MQSASHAIKAGRRMPPSAGATGGLLRYGQGPGTQQNAEQPPFGRTRRACQALHREAAMLRPEKQGMDKQTSKKKPRCMRL